MLAARPSTFRQIVLAGPCGTRLRRRAARGRTTELVSIRGVASRQGEPVTQGQVSLGLLPVLRRVSTVRPTEA